MSFIASIIGPEMRAGGELRRDPAYLALEGLSSGRSSSGEPVTAATSMALSAYFGCLRNISEDVAKLPLKVFRELTPRGKVPVPNDPIYQLLHDQPNAAMTSMVFRETLTHWALGWGGGVAEIVRDINGVAVELWPIHPSRVKINTDQSMVRYEVHSHDIGDEAIRVLDDTDVLHIYGLGYEGIQGYSVLHYASESLGLGLAAQTFGAAFFGNNTAIGGVLEHPKALSDQAAKNLRQSWSKKYAGSSNAGKTLIAEEGMQYKSVGIPPEQAQFIETRMFQVEEVCRWFRMPPHKVQHLLRATFSNIESQNIEYVQDTLMAWLTRWEQEIKRKLLDSPDQQDLRAQHNVTALLRGENTARAEFHQKEFMSGGLTINEHRDLEDKNPIRNPLADEPWVPVNMVPISQFSTEPEVVEDTDPDAPVMPARDDAARAGGLIVSDVLCRIVQKERRATERAMHKHGAAGFEAWAEQFYDELHECITQALDAPLRALCWIIGQTDTTAAAEEADRYAYYHVAVARRKLRESFPAMYEIDIDERADRVVTGLMGQTP